MMDATEELAVLCRQVRSRSAEHKISMSAVMAVGAFGQAVGILRQEVDSMVRIMYLLSITDPVLRENLITTFVSGGTMRRGNGQRVTDREMVDLGQTLHGWTKSVYQFGCSFIHLSSFHDWSDRNPLDQIPDEERRQILTHMRYYHGGPAEEHPTFHEFATYLPRVLDKIAGNLECYVETLEKGEVLS